MPSHAERARLVPVPISWRSAICESDLSATVRHVALTLSVYMSERGDSAYPGAERLSHDTGLSERAVRTALATLVQYGWLELVTKGGGRKKANEYRALIPERVHDIQGNTFTESDSLNETTVNPAPHDTKPCTTITPSLQELTKNSPGEPEVVEEAITAGLDPLFDEMHAKAGRPRDP